MRVGSELKDAFLEVSSTVEVDCTKKSQIKYDDNSGAVAVGNGTETEYVVTSQYKTLGDLRSAFYPTGTLLHSLLDESAFRDFMGDTGVAAVDNKWRNANTFVNDTDASYVLVEQSTTLGTYLMNAGATQKNVSGTDYVLMATPKGRYLRASDPSVSKDGITLHSNTPLLQQNESHTHSYTSPRSRGGYFIGTGETFQNYNVHDAVGSSTGGNGGDESRPDSLVSNLYIKVNE